MKNILFALLILFIPTTIFGEINDSTGKEKTGIELLWECTGRDTKLKEAGILTCISYLSGILDSQAIIRAVYPKSQMFCVPTRGATKEQALRVVVGWLKANPKTLHQSARISVFLALKDAFPCRK